MGFIEDICISIWLIANIIAFISAIVFIIKLITKKKKKITVIVFCASLVIAIAAFLTYGVVYLSSQCDHDYVTLVNQEPTCTVEGVKEQYCPLCDYTDRETIDATGHKMVTVSKKEPTYEADGELVEKCSVCGYEEVTKINMLIKESNADTCEHEWINATCETPKTCSLCGLEEGSIAEHIAGDWVDDFNIVTATVFRYKYCINCGEKMDSDIKSFSLHNEDKFLFSAEDFSERLGSMFSVLYKNYSYDCNYKCDTLVMDDGSIYCGVTDTKAISVILFHDSQGNKVKPGEKDISTITATINSTNASDNVNVLLGVLLTCDASLEVEDALELAKQIMKSTMSSTPYYHNGIGYVCGYSGDYLMLVVSLT